jgi:hypothetical protein
MGNNHDSAKQHAQGDIPFLPIIEMVINECDARSREYLLGVPEIQAMFEKVATVLGIIPLDHTRSSICSYRQATLDGAALSSRSIPGLLQTFRQQILKNAKIQQ